MNLTQNDRLNQVTSDIIKACEILNHDYTIYHCRDISGMYPDLTDKVIKI